MCTFLLVHKCKSIHVCICYVMCKLAKATTDGFSNIFNVLFSVSLFTVSSCVGVKLFQSHKKNGTVVCHRRNTLYNLEEMDNEDIFCTESFICTESVVTIFFFILFLAMVKIIIQINTEKKIQLNYLFL